MTFLLLAAALAFAQDEAGRTAKATGVGVIRGQVIDQETGQPIARASVVLLISGGGALPRENIADDQGRFEFTDVPAGVFDLTATAGELRATHVRGFYRPRDGSRVPPLAAGETRTEADIALARSLAISGRVVNEAGEPLARVRLRVRGAVRYYDSGFRTTDDRGRFRIFGLERGAYLICAAIDTSSSAPRASRERYVTTCHPGEPSEATAQPVTVGDADVDGIEIRLRRSRVFSISGLALDSAGQPLEAGTISLDEYTATSSSNSPMPLKAGGRFTIHDLPPGQYSLSARVGGPDQPEYAGESARGAVMVDVVDADVDGVVIRTRKAATLFGRVVFEGGVPPSTPADLVPFSIGLARDARLRRAGASIRQAAFLRGNPAFEIEDVYGPVKLQATNPPRGWIVKSIRYRGRDITVAPTEFPAGRHEIEVIMSDRGAVVTGTVVDDKGAPEFGARVIMFPADPAEHGDEPAFEMTVRTNKEGRFTFEPRRPGEYLIVALPGTGEPFGDYTPALFERMAVVAERITLIEADRRTVDLRLSSLPESRRLP